MSALEILQPVDESLLSLDKGSIGERIKLYVDDFPEGSIIIISCPDMRGVGIENQSKLNWIRKEFYQLIYSDWKYPIYDLGEIVPGLLLEDTHLALQEIIRELISKKTYPIILGGSVDLSYSMFKGLNILDIPINYTAIDSHIYFNREERINQKNYISKIITDEDSLLFHFANLGYQSYYVSYDIIKLMESMDFEYLRLGEVIEDIKEVEPILRGTNLVSINMDALGVYTGISSVDPSPNGFSGRDICTIGRYIGLSNQIKTVGIFNFLSTKHNKLTHKLVSQLMWYIIEGKNRQDLYSSKEYLKYTILQEDKELVFLKDKEIDKWWISIEGLDNKNLLVPCSFKDYKSAIEGSLPERYWRTFKRFL